MAKAAKKTQTTTRKYKSQQKITHDLFKLEVAEFTKNIAWEPGLFNPVKVSHCHFFHSVDKNGAPQDKCAPIGGHFHIMELVQEATDESPAIYKCGPAKKYVLKKQPNGSYKKVIVDVPHDSHTHELTYIDSHDFKPAKMNPEAIKLIAEQSRAPSAPAGIVG